MFVTVLADVEGHKQHKSCDEAAGLKLALLVYFYNGTIQGMCLLCARP